MKRVLCLVMALVLLVATACTPKTTPTPPPATPAPLVVTDSLGRRVTIQPPVQRIVSLAPSNTEILFALGAGDLIVGVDNFSDYPEEAKQKPKVGAPFPGFNMEAILAQEPQLIVTIPGQDVAKLEATGKPVLVIGPKDIKGVMAGIELLGTVVGRESQAREIAAQMKQRFDAVSARAGQSSARPRVFYEVDGTEPTKPWTAGAGTFVDALIALAGGINVAAQGGAEWYQISSEELVRQDPAIILLGDAQFGVTVAEVRKRPGWDAITAVKQGTIYPIDADITTRPGPRLVLGAEQMARQIHPELFR